MTLLHLPKRRTKWTLTICFTIMLCKSGSSQTEFKLNPDDGKKDSLFGYSVATSDGRTIVGSGGDNGLSPQSGSAYIFRGSGADLLRIAKLVASDGAKDDRFGTSVAISGDVAIVGASGDDDLGQESGSAYVFEWNGSAWTQVKKLTAADGSSGDLFGSSVAINGDFALIGAPGDFGIDEQTGSAYIFRRIGLTWIQVMKLLSSDGLQGDLFGISVAISDNYAIVGASGDDHLIDDDDDNDDDDTGQSTDAGSAYIYRQNGINWLQIKKLISNDQAKDDRFGTAVALTDSCAIVSAIGDDSNAGGAYVFNNTGADWIQTGKLIANDRSAEDGFGNSVSQKGDLVIIGASGDDDLGDQSGSAHIFRRGTSGWMAIKKLTASDGSKEDLFGFAAAVGEDYAVVGAPNDDDLGNQSGSGYVYNFATLSATPLSLDFADSLSRQTLTLSNDGIGTAIAWTISADQPWISVNPASGLLPAGSGSAAVIVDRTGLAGGDYSGTATINSNVGNTTIAIRMTVAAAPTAKLEPLTKIDETTATVNGTVSPDNQTIEVVFEYGLTTNYGDTADATPKIITGSTPISVSAEISGLTPGTEYHYRIVATGNAGTVTSIDGAFTTYATEFALSAAINFPVRSNAYDYDATEYRIVGLPGASNQLIASLFSGIQDRDWQVYSDNGNSDNFLLPYNGSDLFRLTAGRAFWIISKDSWPINMTVPVAPLNSESAVEIPLRQGFNLITNPFPTPINWADVQAFNDITNPIFSYNGSFTDSPRFEPFVGYYFFNEDLAVLKVPYILTFSPAPGTSFANNYLWKINVSVSSDSFEDGLLSLGTAREASHKIDQFDFRKPRAASKSPSIYFNRVDWDSDFSIFASDIRPAIEEFETWLFEVSSTPLTSLQLTFEDVESVPAQYDVYLINEANGDQIDLRSESSYHFRNQKPLSTFRVVVGERGAIGETLDTALPTEFALEDNYPNPFNPSTSFYISLPVASMIKVKVYNILGKEIKTIYDGLGEPGKRLFSWNGTDANGREVASGVYIYILTTNEDISLTRKMILMK
jgi:hypothetical protein